MKRYFQVGSETVKALRGVSFKIYEGEFVTIQGTSGSGKSTLLNQLGCLDTPTSGEYLLDGISVRTMSKTKRAKLRNRKIGFVFQSYNLLPKTTALENVELPLMYNSEISAAERHEKAVKALQAVGLGDRMYHKSNQMSGGQMQRVAIARALVNDPAVLLADEATGNLDTRTSFEMLVLFQELYKQGHTIIFVTHNPEIAEYSSRNINLRDGKIREDTVNVANNKMRSFLSMLGIIIGVAAVIIMMSIGQGSKESIRAELSTMGTNLLTIRPGADMRGGVRQDPSSMQTLKMADYERIVREKKFVTKVSPEVTASGQAIYGNNNTNSTMYGESVDYLDIKQWAVEEGECFTEEDIKKAAKVVVVGTTIVKELFGENVDTIVKELFGENVDPIGKTIRFKSIPMRIVGVLKSKGYNSWGMDQDNVIIAPYTTVMKRIAAQTYFSSIVCSAVTEELSDAAIEELTQILRDNHKLKDDADDDFTIRSQAESDHHPRGGCCLLTARGRYRYHEHHVGECDGAHQGDRSPHGCRCHGPGHLPAVPDRIGADILYRRTDRCARGRRCQHVPEYVRHAVECACLEYLRVVPGMRVHRCALRLYPCPEGCQHGSDRGYPT